MRIKTETCGTCAGVGKHYNWKTIHVDDDFGTMEREEVVCQACNGRGYSEYAVFSVREAATILERLGMNNQSFWDNYDECPNCLHYGWSDPCCRECKQDGKYRYFKRR